MHLSQFCVVGRLFEDCLQDCLASDRRNFPLHATHRLGNLLRTPWSMMAAFGSPVQLTHPCVIACAQASDVGIPTLFDNLREMESSWNVQHGQSQNAHLVPCVVLRFCHVKFQHGIEVTREVTVPYRKVTRLWRSVFLHKADNRPDARLPSTPYLPCLPSTKCSYESTVQDGGFQVHPLYETGARKMLQNGFF